MKIVQCRSCKSRNIKNAFTLGSQSLTGVFPNKKNLNISKGELSLVFCKNCSLLQLENSFNPEEMYGENYGYMSSLNQSMFNHLKNKVNYSNDGRSELDMKYASNIKKERKESTPAKS